MIKEIFKKWYFWFFLTLFLFNLFFLRGEGIRIYQGQLDLYFLFGSLFGIFLATILLSFVIYGVVGLVKKIIKWYKKREVKGN